MHALTLYNVNVQYVYVTSDNSAFGEARGSVHVWDICHGLAFFHLSPFSVLDKQSNVWSVIWDTVIGVHYNHLMLLTTEYTPTVK